MRQCALLLLETLDPQFPTARETHGERVAGPEESFDKAVATLRRARVEVQPDSQAYVEQRRRWEPLVRRVAPSLGYEMDEIERRAPPQGPAGA